LTMPRRPVRSECGRRMSRRDHECRSTGAASPPGGPTRRPCHMWSPPAAAPPLESESRSRLGCYCGTRAPCTGPGPAPTPTCILRGPGAANLPSVGVGGCYWHCGAAPSQSAVQCNEPTESPTSRRRRPRHRRHTRSSSSTPRCTHRCHRRHGPTAPCGSARVRPTAPNTRARRTGVLPSTERPRSNARADSDGSPRAKSM
jgi:hypothetical protein